jgi:hypothetical protein
VTIVKTIQGQQAKPGDTIEVAAHAVGGSSRVATILEVIGALGHEHYRVRWQDDHESILFPGSGAVIRPKRGGSGRPARAVPHG